jgi:predicted RNA-binding Zn-ribbon protein involved in translation (DUF1610 family)
VEDGELEGRRSAGLKAAAEGMAQWRREHPRATLSEIEDALDERLAAVRSEMLVETVMTSPAAQFAGASPSERPTCPECGDRLVSRGQAERRLTTVHGQDVRLRRNYAHCRSCGLELFPPR